METNTLEVKVRGGKLVAMINGDRDFPGICVEFVADNENEDNISRPSVLVESLNDRGVIRAVAWTDVNNEDYTDVITLNVETPPISESVLESIREQFNNPTDFLIAVISNADRELTKGEMFDIINVDFGYKYCASDIYAIIEEELEREGNK